MKILIIDSSNPEIELLKLEFVKPIEQILENNNFKFETINFKKINEKIIEEYNKIIISGTALKDFEYLNHLDKFEFIKTSKKSILGICAGFHIIGLLNNLKLIENQEIGIHEINVIQENKLIEKSTIKSYCLHKKTLDLKNQNQFEIIAKNKNSIQIIKEKNKEIYGIQFHPEVKNHEIISNFLK